MPLEIKLKFDTKDTVFALHDNKVMKGKVECIRIGVNKNPNYNGPSVVVIEYSIEPESVGRSYRERENKDYVIFPEDKVFATKEALLASL